MKLNFVLFLFLSIVSCRNTNNSSFKINPPTESEIAEAIKQYELDEQTLSQLNIFTDYKEGIEHAKQVNKPVILMFTGYAAFNSRKLEEQILETEEMFLLMKENFVNIWLYVDDRSETAENYMEFQQERFESNEQPLIYILNSSGKKIAGGIGYADSEERLFPILKNISKKWKALSTINKASCGRNDPA